MQNIRDSFPKNEKKAFKYSLTNNFEIGEYLSGWQEQPGVNIIEFLRTNFQSSLGRKKVPNLTVPDSLKVYSNADV